MKFIPVAVGAMICGATIALLAPRSVVQQVRHAGTLLAVSDDPDRGAFQIAPTAAAALDAAGVQMVIIESDGSGIAIRSLNQFTAFYDRGMAETAQRVVLTKSSHGWTAARDCQYSDINSPLDSLAKMLADHAARTSPAA